MVNFRLIVSFLIILSLFSVAAIACGCPSGGVQVCDGTPVASCSEVIDENDCGNSYNFNLNKECYWSGCNYNGCPGEICDNGVDDDSNGEIDEDECCYGDEEPCQNECDCDEDGLCGNEDNHKCCDEDNDGVCDDDNNCAQSDLKCDCDDDSESSDDEDKRCSDEDEDGLCDGCTRTCVFRLFRFCLRWKVECDDDGADCEGECKEGRRCIGPCPPDAAVSECSIYDGLENRFECPNHYQLIDGEGRWCTFKLLTKKCIPSSVKCTEEDPCINNQAPSINLIDPPENSEVNPGETIKLTYQFSDPDGDSLIARAYYSLSPPVLIGEQDAEVGDERPGYGAFSFFVPSDLQPGDVITFILSAEDQCANTGEHAIFVSAAAAVIPEFSTIGMLISIFAIVIVGYMFVIRKRKQ